MQRFLQRFALLVAGTLSGFDRVVFKGKLCPLYAPDGMNWLLRANHVMHNDFKRYAAEVTARVVDAAGVPEAKARGCYRYLNSSKIDKEQVAQSNVQQGSMHCKTQTSPVLPPRLAANSWATCSLSILLELR